MSRVWLGNERTIEPAAVGHIAVQRFLLDERLDPKLWRRVQRGDDGDAWEQWSSVSPLRVIWSIADELDGRTWLHVSLSRPDRLPSYSDVTRVKRLFVGAERTAYTVLADEARHVNIHANCLHVWAVLEGDEPLPDFTRGGRSI